MRAFLCRWPNGDLAIVGARDPEHAIVILDQLGDATEAALFETENLLIDFELDDQGHLKLNRFGDRLHDEVMEQAYPLIRKAIMESDVEDEEDFPEATAAERLRLSQEQIHLTDELTRNIFIARLATDEQITLNTAIEKYKQELPIPSQAWHDLAAKSSVPNRIDEGLVGHLRSLPTPYDVPHCEEDDLLPHYLLTAVLADEMNASMLTIWRDVEQHTSSPIGTYWHWMAQEVRKLPTTESPVN